MEAIFALAILVIALAGFDAAASRFGADSRDQLPDDHHRGAHVAVKVLHFIVHRVLAEVPEDRTSHPSPLRRPAARVLAALSRGSAAAVRRLDDCIADDLGRSLAPSEQ